MQRRSSAQYSLRTGPRRSPRLENRERDGKEKSVKNARVLVSHNYCVSLKSFRWDAWIEPLARQKSLFLSEDKDNMNERYGVRFYGLWLSFIELCFTRIYI